MTDTPPESARPQAKSQADLALQEDDKVTVMPWWVPVVIASVLLVLASLAVYTGMRYRAQTLVRVVHPQSPPASSRTPAPPGEPEPGASLVYPGQAGDTTPAARPPVQGRARSVITGTGGNIESVPRIWARRGLVLAGDPPDALLYVNDVPIGHASQFGRQPYEFPQPGSYTIRLSAPGSTDKTAIVTVDEKAKNEIARIQYTLLPKN